MQRSGHMFQPLGKPLLAASFLNTEESFPMALNTPRCTGCTDRDAGGSGGKGDATLVGWRPRRWSLRRLMATGRPLLSFQSAPTQQSRDLPLLCSSSIGYCFAFPHTAPQRTVRRPEPTSSLSPSPGSHQQPFVVPKRTRSDETRSASETDTSSTCWHRESSRYSSISHSVFSLTSAYGY